MTRVSNRSSFSPVIRVCRAPRRKTVTPPPTKTKRISLIFGTRPEAIKLCPLVLELRKHPGHQVHVCSTGQHRQMLDQVLHVFNVKPDVDLALMQPDQSLGTLTARAMAALDQYLAECQPDLVIVQGDTTTAFCASLAAFYRRIPVGHLEAGLRTGDKFAPFPEEINRVLVTRLADYHFAPTTWARDNLLKENIPADRISVTGNTVVDALQLAVHKIHRQPPEIPGLPHELLNGRSGSPLVLITGHRRESFGQGFENICRAIATLSRRFRDVSFVYPVHLNPNVRRPVLRILRGYPNVHLLEPLSYLSFVALMLRSTLILTDSGGIQEEAPSLRKPVLIMRDTTERPEAIEAGTALLVGSDPNRIIDHVSMLLTDPNAYCAMADAPNPYGDGRACQRIARIIHEVL